MNKKAQKVKQKENNVVCMEKLLNRKKIEFYGLSDSSESNKKYC
jgi:hypothetical protein